MIEGIDPKHQHLFEGRTPEGIEALRELARKQLEARRLANPLKYFVPNGWSERLIRDFGEKKHKWIYVLPAANSITKSATCINIIGNLIWGVQNQWFNYPRFKEWTYPKKVWYVSENSTLKDFICGFEDDRESEIKKWFPKGRYKFYKSGLEFFSRLTSDTDWSINFKTYDMDASKFESDKIGLVVLDEPGTEAIFNAVISRLTLGGIVLMPMTPLFQAAWVKDKLVDQATEKSPIHVAYGDIEENCVEHGIRGRLSHDQIQAIVSQYDPDEVSARAHGQFMFLSGLVLKGIDPARHRHNIPADRFGQDEFKIYCVVDPHDAWPPIIGWFAVDKFKQVWAVDEYPEEDYHNMKGFNKTTKDIARIIRDKEEQNKWEGRLVRRIMDPNFGKKPIQAVGMTVQEYYAKCGREISYPLNFDCNVNDNLEAGHNLIKEAIKFTAETDPHLKIGEKCTNIWRDINRYSIRPQSDRKEEIDGMTELVGKKFKGGVDIVRYLLMAMRPPSQGQVTENREREWYEDLVRTNSGYDDNIPNDWRNPFDL